MKNYCATVAVLMEGIPFPSSRLPLHLISFEILELLGKTWNYSANTYSTVLTFWFVIKIKLSW